MQTIQHDTNPRSDFDEVDHVAEVVGRKAVFTTYEGERIIGTVEAGDRWSSGMAKIRFDDGRWGRADSTIELVVEG